MKRKAILLGVLSLFVAGPGSAAVMDTWIRISLQFTNLTRAEASDTGIGVSTLNTSGAGAHLYTLALGNSTLPGLSLNTVLPVTDPIVSIGGLVSVRLTNVRAGNVPGPNNDLGVFAPISGAIQSTMNPAGGLGTLPSTGMVRFCFFAIGCSSNLPLDLGKTINGVAQGFGAGGLLTIGQLGTIRVSMLGAPYTVKTVSAFAKTNNGGLQIFTEHGFAHGPLSNTSSTAQTSGVIQLVTPHRTSDQTSIYPRFDAFSRVLVHFIPEPGLLLLLGSGAAAMALLGRKRMRR